MRRSYPHGFALFVMMLLLALLAGYLWLADIVPKQGPSPIREMTPNTAKGPATDDNANTWQTYMDETFGFSLRYPNAWFASVDTQKDYTVNFLDVDGNRHMSVRVLKAAKKEEVIAALRKRSARGLFQAETSDAMPLLDGTAAETILNYTTPRGDMSVSNAVIEKNGLIFVLEEQRRTTLQADANYFDRWVRSLSI